jgi:hypothetical protein
MDSSSNIRSIFAASPRIQDATWIALPVAIIGLVLVISLMACGGAESKTSDLVHPADGESFGIDAAMSPEQEQGQRDYAATLMGVAMNHVAENEKCLQMEEEQGAPCLARTWRTYSSALDFEPPDDLGAAALEHREFRDAVSEIAAVHNRLEAGERGDKLMADLSVASEEFQSAFLAWVEAMALLGIDTRDIQ